MSEKTAEVVGPSGTKATVPVDNQGHPQTIKYIGTDHHSRKFLTGSFRSNVGPKHFGRRALPIENWECGGCGRSNRSYLRKCFDCLEPRPY